LFKFLGLRVIRIYPALVIEVLLSAFLIGASVTSLPLKNYFRDPLFWKYLLNSLGDIHFFLPGVFKNNPVPDLVNFQLWTVPYELFCYAILAGLVILGRVIRKVMIPLAAFGLVIHFMLNDVQAPSIVGRVNGELLVIAFLTGVSLYLYKDKIPWSFPILAGAMITSVPLLRRARYRTPRKTRFAAAG